MNPSQSTWVDKAGAWLGSACALHCGMTPVIFALGPLFGAWWGWMESLHLPSLIAISLLAGFSLGLGWRRHGHYYAGFFLVPGLSMLWMAYLLLTHGTLQIVAMTAGGTLVVAGHLLNLRLAHGHVHDAQCPHQHRSS